MARISRPLLMALMVLLAGCQAGVMVRVDDSGRAQNLAGRQLILEQPVRVAGGNTRAFVQRGEVLPGQRFDHYAAHCIFELRTRSEQARTIAPDVFRIQRVQSLLDVVQRPATWTAPRQVAGIGLLAGMDDGGASQYFAGYHLWLASERQPDVMLLTCRGVWAEPHELEPPTLAQMRATLGGIARIAE